MRRGGRPEPVPVTLGLDDGTRVEIASGSLAPGESVIVGQAGGPGAGSEPPRSPFRF